MNPPDQGTAPVLEAVNHMHVPQWPASIEHTAQDAPCQRFQFRFAAGAVQGHAQYVPVNIKMRIVFPGREGKAPRREHGNLPVTRHQVQLRMNAGHEFLEGNRAVKNAHTRNV